MRTFFIILLLTAVSNLASGQKDPAAVKILDRFSSLAVSSPSVYMRFSLQTADQVEGTSTLSSGSILLSKDKYRLDLTDNTVWYNGETSWSYLPAENEVTISKPDKKDNSFQSKPSAVFSVYKKGYKIRLLEESTTSYLIDLYPEDINSDHIRIRLIISKPSLTLQSAEYKYKNGITVTLTVTEYDLSQKPENSAFTFFPEKYKDVEIVDMR